MPPKPKPITVNDYGVRIDGLRAFQKALKAVGDKFPGELREANYDLASSVVERARLRALTVPGVAAKAAKSLRAARTANQASVTGGGARYPYFYGAEFGSKRYKQFQPWRGNQWSGWAGGPGYFLHPTLRDEAPALIEDYMRRIDALTSEAFPETGV